MGIGIKELVIILLIVLLVFGAKKLKTIGADLGSAVKGFKKGMQDDDKPSAQLGDESRRNDSNAASRNDEHTPR